jgi:lambda family phage portal protein
MSEPNALDNVIGFFNPEAGVKRARARMTLEQARKYDGAAGGRRNQNWHAPSTSADAALGPSLERLRNRSRDLSRNNPFAARAVQVLVNNTVGGGVLGQIHSRSRNRASRWNQAWEDWAKNPHLCDHDGRADFWGLQALVFRTVVESGECLIRKRIDPRAEFPLKLQILEPDFIDDGTKDGLTEDGGYIRQGVEYGPNDERIAYHLHRQHPGDRVLALHKYETVKVPADEIIHVFRRDRPGQGRGVPWGAPVISRLRDFDDFSDAQLLKQKISACFTGFVIDSESQDTGGTPPLAESLEPGSIEILPAGKDVRFASPPSVGEFDQFSRSMLLQIAAGYGVTYEALTSDLSHANYSAARMGHLEFARNVDCWQKQILVAQMLGPIWGWFKQSAEIIGDDPADVRMHWTPAKRELIDPQKEVGAIIEAVRGGLMSLSEAIRRSGYEPGEVLAEIARDAAMLDELGLILDTDPRNVTAAGMLQMEPQQETETDD